MDDRDERTPRAGYGVARPWADVVNGTVEIKQGYAPADGATHYPYDSPLSPLGNTSTDQYALLGVGPVVWHQREDRFEATLMFLSDAPGSTPVPLKKLTFEWGGSASWDANAGQWTPGSLGLYAIAGTSSDTNDYPVWAEHNDNTLILQ